MSFTPRQQGLFRPMVSRAWETHARGEGLDARDKAAKDAWYRAELCVCLGRDTTKDGDATRDFETVMAHFEMLCGDNLYWNLRVHQGDTRRLQYAIAALCERWEIDDAYARATAARILKWEGRLESLAAITNPADLQKVRIALIIHARRQGNREDQVAAGAKVVANPALATPPAAEQKGRIYPLQRETRTAFESPGVKARREAREEGSRELLHAARAAGTLPKKPRAKSRPVRQAGPQIPVAVEDDNCPF